MLYFCSRCSACNHSSQIIRHEQTWTDVARVGFRHLICMFSLLMFQAEICGNPHHTANKAAFNSKHAEHSCVLWLRYSLFSHISGAAFEARIALGVSALPSKDPKREYWLGVSSLPAVCLLPSAARNLKGRSWQTFLNGLFVHFDLLFGRSTRTAVQGGSKSLWNARPASSAHHLSALSEKKKQRWFFWTLFCLH